MNTLNTIKNIIMHKHIFKFKNLSDLSLRLNHSDSLNNITGIEKDAGEQLEQNINNDNDDLKDNIYDIRWSKDYKNLNKLLGIKGVRSNQIIDINKIKYLLFSVSNNKLSNMRTDDNINMDLLYSLRLVVSDIKNYSIKKENEWL